MMCRPPPRHAGLSLIEAMVTLFIATAVMGMGVPAMAGWMRRAEVRTTAEALRAGLQLARLEAVQRNAVVRFNLTNSQGLAAWTLGCVQTSAQCPAVIRQMTAGEAGAGARIGVVTQAALAASPAGSAINVGTALVAGSGLPAGISFDAAGRVPLNNLATDIVRIDVTHRATDGPRLQIRLGAAGLVSLCDPAAASGRLEACQ